MLLPVFIKKKARNLIHFPGPMKRRCRAPKPKARDGVVLQVLVFQPSRFYETVALGDLVDLDDAEDMDEADVDEMARPATHHAMPCHAMPCHARLGPCRARS